MHAVCRSKLFPTRRRLDFLAVVSTQFLSSVADNALLIIAIELLLHRHAAEWMFPALRIVFYVSYLLLAPYAGALADGWPKTQVILVTNVMKLVGSALLMTSLHPLLAFALIGLGASAHSAAKYGILSELLPAEELIVANAWIEISTVVSILAGIGIASVLVSPVALQLAPGFQDRGAVAVIVSLYFVTVLVALLIPKTVPKSLRSASNAIPRNVTANFFRWTRLLLRDGVCAVCLTFTSLFWAVAAALQFIILRWGTEIMRLSLSKAALLQGAVAIGVVLGALASARWISLQKTLKTTPLGIGIGIMVIVMSQLTDQQHVTIALILIGVLSGLCLVPMNALLQSRSTVSMGGGQTIAIQNFFENFASLGVLGIYGLLVFYRIPLVSIVLLFGMAVCLAVGALMLLTRRLIFQ